MKADVKLNKLAKLQLHNVECEANYSTHSKALCKRHTLVEISTNGVERVKDVSGAAHGYIKNRQQVLYHTVTTRGGGGG